MSGNVRNSATGNARVGVQAGTVHGGVHLSQPSGTRSSVPAQLAELRDDLAKALAAGSVDAGTFAAATTELDTVTESLPPAGHRVPETAIHALKRLFGLLSDWSELAARVTMLISTLRGDS